MSLKQDREFARECGCSTCMNNLINLEESAKGYKRDRLAELAAETLTFPRRRYYIMTARFGAMCARTNYMFFKQRICEDNRNPHRTHKLNFVEWAGKESSMLVIFVKKTQGVKRSGRVTFNCGISMKL